MNIRLKKFPDTKALIFQCLETFRQIFPNLGKNDGVMLAGGRTPLEIYRRAAAEGLSTNGRLFLSDERYVPVTDPQSNFGTISPFFPTLGRIPTELPIEAAAQAFHDNLSQINRIPLGLLGIGSDGHTASLFNLKDAALRDEQLSIPVIKTDKPDRISVTPTFLHKVDKILILATGVDKKAMIQTLLEKPETIPAGVALANHPHVEIWTDQFL
jgi:6-phosphogluconolactonase/glucosamine-6-phosphate isomerase/deaminase